MAVSAVFFEPSMSAGDGQPTWRAPAGSPRRGQFNASGWQFSGV